MNGFPNGEIIKHVELFYLVVSIDEINLVLMVKTPGGKFTKVVMLCELQDFM